MSVQAAECRGDYWFGKRPVCSQVLHVTMLFFALIIDCVEYATLWLPSEYNIDPANFGSDLMPAKLCTTVSSPVSIASVACTPCIISEVLVPVGVMIAGEVYIVTPRIIHWSSFHHLSTFNVQRSTAMSSPELPICPESFVCIPISYEFVKEIVTIQIIANVAVEFLFYGIFVVLFGLNLYIFRKRYLPSKFYVVATIIFFVLATASLVLDLSARSLAPLSAMGLTPPEDEATLLKLTTAVDCTFIVTGSVKLDAFLFSLLVEPDLLIVSQDTVRYHSALWITLLEYGNIGVMFMAYFFTTLAQNIVLNVLIVGRVVGISSVLMIVFLGLGADNLTTYRAPVIGDLENRLSESDIALVQHRGIDVNESFTPEHTSGHSHSGTSSANASIPFLLPDINGSVQPYLLKYHRSSQIAPSEPLAGPEEPKSGSETLRPYTLKYHQTRNSNSALDEEGDVPAYRGTVHHGLARPYLLKYDQTLESSSSRLPVEHNAIGTVQPYLFKYDSTPENSATATVDGNGVEVIVNNDPGDGSARPYMLKYDYPSPAVIENSESRSTPESSVQSEVQDQTEEYSVEYQKTSRRTVTTGVYDDGKLMMDIHLLKGWNGPVLLRAFKLSSLDKKKRDAAPRNESFSQKACYYQYYEQGQPMEYRPALNLPKIVQLARQHDSSSFTAEVVRLGKKRARSRSPSALTDSPRKRAKIPRKASTSENPSPASMYYPTMFDPIPKQSIDDKQSVPASCFTLEISYTTETPQDEPEDHFEKWRMEEDWFRRELEDLSAGSADSVSIDLGAVELSYVQTRRVYAITTRSDTPCWLALVPVFNPGDSDWESYDLTSSRSNDIIHCLYTLASYHRIEMEARLKLVIIPGENGPSFCIEIVIAVSFVTPTIFEPVTGLKRTVAVELDDAQRRVLLFFYPPAPPPASFEGAVNIPFYYSILGPAPSLQSNMAEAAMQPESLKPTLLPFQRRSVGWLLDREGMTISDGGKVVPKADPTSFSFWRPIDVNGLQWFFYPLTGSLSEEAPSADEAQVARGGILAEEPGLGKTIETISLILLNPSPPHFNPTLSQWDPVANLTVKAIKSTLIVTPATLANQWFDELKTHAPASEFSYMTVDKLREKRRQSKQRATRKAARPATKSEAQARINKKGKGKSIDVGAIDFDDEEEIVDWCSYVHTFDVVITTYNVLQSDLNVARAPPKRPRREGVVYLNIERPRSPLVMVEWTRVVMDEVQMAGGGKTEDMVSLIPRRSSLAVSGTPARAQVSDLSHVLKFLRFDVGSTRLWNRLLCPATMKSQISDELEIPQQTRYLVSIEMGRVERLVYDQSLEAVLNDLGLDARGVAATENWEVDASLLRTSIRRLRGICTHPQVGQVVGQNERLYKAGGTLKTMADVLQVMKDQNWRNLVEDWKTKIQAMIKTAQLKQLNTQALNRFRSVLEDLLPAEKEGERMINEIERVIAEHDVKGEALKKEVAERRKGKGKQREDPSLSEEEDEDNDGDEDDGENEGLPNTPAGKEHRDKRRAVMQRLREARIQYHRIKFLLGDVYHNLGEKYSVQENNAYATAEGIRRDLLKGTEREAKNGMTQLSLDVIGGKSGVTKTEMLIPVPYVDQGGIRSAEFIEELHEIIENVLNDQTELLWEWRSKIHSLLTQSLNPGGEDDADGQEYQRTLDNQGEAETFLQAYAALLADRREALTNERTVLAAHDVASYNQWRWISTDDTRETKLRKTKAALKATAAVDQLDIPEDVEIQPEHQVFYKELSDQRKQLLTELEGRAVKSVLVELSGALSRTPERDPERPLLLAAIADVRKLIATQQTIMDKMTADLALFRKAFNQRVLYFRQLQEISDSVAEVEFEGPRSDAQASSEQEIKDLDAKLVATRAHQRYLDHLVKSNEDDEMDEDEKCCILCRCEFERGFIPSCAHIFCEVCLKEWMAKKDGKSCPVCRVPIDLDHLQRFKLNEPKEASAPNPIVNGEIVPVSHRKIGYNMIDPTIFETIQSMEAIGDYGSKIQTLVRHIMYLERVDPGSKSIVFSAWADSLTRIQSIRVDRGTRGEGPVKKFKTKPEISVLLLHGERENAGLNVTCASRVFLLESVVHHGFEIQDTVERNILDLAARQGLSLYTKKNSVGTLNVSSFASDKQTIDSPGKNSRKTVKGDFISKLDDLLACLFPHMFEEVEYLIPPEDLVMTDVTNTHNAGPFSTRVKGKGRAVQENAVAGPSRSN
ncbi:hypothetical protein D9757_008356 [Collybiopsis confluens]|uniref:RING-type domain-containing protein n=1 Tax=Collybiopsis confluens TaxID=2823264 RepID=A0A8H5HEF0_9AGAR|nr:hypothetical protein D9757_008356 [Collybiopsis confluens]